MPISVSELLRASHLIYCFIESIGWTQPPPARRMENGCTPLVHAVAAWHTSFTIASGLHCDAVDKPPSTKRGSVTGSVAVRCTCQVTRASLDSSFQTTTSVPIGHSYLYSPFTPPANKYTPNFRRFSPLLSICLHTNSTIITIISNVPMLNRILAYRLLS